MVKTLALIQDNLVFNTILCDENYLYQITSEYVIIDDITPKPSIGWSYVNGVFTPPPPPPPPPPQTVFTKFEFRTRFTLNELIGVDNFATNSTLTAEQKATLNTITKNFDAAQTIDLTNTATIQGVDYLATVGLLTSDRAKQILTP